MTALQMRRVAEKRLRTLPPSKLKVAAEFLAFLEISAIDEATAELLRIPGLLADIQSAKREIAAGKGENWRSVRSDV